MVVNNNPAGILYNILEEIRRADLRHNTPFAEDFSKAFDIDCEDTGKFLNFVVRLISLVREIKEAISSSPNIRDKEAFSGMIEELELLVSRFDSSISLAQFKIDPISSTCLRFCSEMLSKEFPDYSIDEDELNAVLIEVQELIERIADSDLPQDLKAMFYGNLENIRKAIVEYKIWGISKLRECVDVSIGQSIRSAISIKENIENTGVTGFFDVLRKLDLLLNVGQKVGELIYPVFKYMLGK